MTSAREQVAAALEISKKATQGKWAIDGSWVANDEVAICQMVNDLDEEIFNIAHITTMNPEFAQALLEGWLQMDAALAELTFADRRVDRCIAEDALKSARSKLSPPAHESDGGKRE